jgi:hypothetical protein
MHEKPYIPNSFEGPPLLFKPIATKDEAEQPRTKPALGKSQRSTLHLTGSKQELIPAGDSLVLGILAAGTPDTD